MAKGGEGIMSNKIFIFLLIVLGFNTWRYGSYLLDGPESVYYILSFLLNLFAIIFVIISTIKTRPAV